MQKNALQLEREQLILENEEIEKHEYRLQAEDVYYAVFDLMKEFKG